MRLHIMAVGLLGIVVMIPVVAHAGLVLTFDHNIVVGELRTIGGLEFDRQTGLLWMVGKHGAIDPVVMAAAWDLDNGQVIQEFYPGAVDIDSFRWGISIAVHPTSGELFVFGSRREYEYEGDDDYTYFPDGGVFTQSGDFVRRFADLDRFINASTFDTSGILYSAGSGYSRIDPVTGARTDIVPIDELTSDVGAAAIDPLTGHLFVYDAFAHQDDKLSEIDLANGELLSTTNVGESLIGDLDAFSSGLAFSASGDRLYIAGTNPSYTHSRLVVLNRIIPEPSALCLALIGSLAFCVVGTARRGRYRAHQ